MSLTIAEEWGADANIDDWEKSNQSDYIKVKATLKQLLREWSDEGVNERQSFGKIIDELELKYPDINQRFKHKILIPGVGLGRLNFELVKRGFNVQGNDFSYFMLFLSNFVLNHTFISNNFDIYPFIHSTSNQLSRPLQLRPVYIPDVLPSKELQIFQSEHPSIPVNELMSITSGSFIDLYGPNNLQISSTYSNDINAKEFRESNVANFDIVITLFFIDTASNIIDYLKTIQNCLKKFGKWINLGPLLWHFEDYSDTQLIVTESGESITVPINGLELTKNDLFELINSFFQFEKKETLENITYGSDIKALGRWTYDCHYFIATNNK